MSNITIRERAALCIDFVHSPHKLQEKLDYIAAQLSEAVAETWELAAKEIEGTLGVQYKDIAANLRARATEEQSYDA